MEIPGHPRFSALLRKAVLQICEMTGFCENESSRITLAVDEAFTNVIRHTYRMEFGQKVRVRLSFLENDHLHIELEDDGPPMDPARIKSRALEEIKPGGLGVHFIHTIMDRVEYLPGDSGNSLRMWKYLKSQPCPKEENEEKRKADLLQALLDIGQSLPWILDISTLLALIVKKVKELMNCQGASVLLLDRENHELVFHTVLDEDEEVIKKLTGLRFPASKGIAGRVVQTGKAVFVRDVERDADHFKGVDEKTGGTTSSLLYAPLQLHGRIIGILSAKDKKGTPFGESDIHALTVIAETVALSVDNACAHEKLRDTDRIKQELLSARLMHKATLPQKIPEMRGVRASATCEPASEVGGDYYDFFVLGDEVYAFTIGDVSGHGLEAGMMVSMARSCLYTQIHFSSKIGDIMAAMNRMVYGSVNRRLIMTFFFGIYESGSQTVTFSNAGHPSPYHYSSKERQWRIIEEGEFPLGVIEHYAYPTYLCPLKEGDFLVLYSDGILEAINPQGQRYGSERFLQLLRSKEWSSPDELESEILRGVSDFCQGVAPTDDRTMLILSGLMP